MRFIWSSLRGWKAECTLEPSNTFESRGPDWKSSALTTSLLLSARFFEEIQSGVLWMKIGIREKKKWPLKLGVVRMPSNAYMTWGTCSWRGRLNDDKIISQWKAKLFCNAFYQLYFTRKKEAKDLHVYICNSFRLMPGLLFLFFCKGHNCSCSNMFCFS